MNDINLLYVIENCNLDPTTALDDEYVMELDDSSIIDVKTEFPSGMTIVNMNIGE